MRCKICTMHSSWGRWRYYRGALHCRCNYCGFFSAWPRHLRLTKGA